MNRSMTDSHAARNVRARGFVAQMERTERAVLAREIAREDMAEIERAGISKRIRQARKEAGLSQPEMAAALQVIPRTYQNYESAKDPRTPWGLMNEISKVTGKTTEWLIHGNAAATPDLMATTNGSSQLDRLEAKLDRLLSLIERADIQPLSDLGDLVDPGESVPGAEPESDEESEDQDATG